MQETWFIIERTLSYVGGVFVGREAADQVGGPIRIAEVSCQVFGVSMLADSSINLAVKPWTTVADYGAAGAELYQAIVERFRERNISIPFPQREVRLLEHH